MCNSSAPGSSVLGPVLQGELARRTRNRVVAVEAGAAEAVLPLLCGGDHRVDGEIGQGGSPDVGSDLLHRQVRAYELIRTIHVDAVIAGAFDRGRRDPEVDLSSAGLEEQLDQLAARVAAYDGVVHDDHPFAFDHAGQRVELEPDAELAHTVGRLDESTANVAVLYKAFRVRDAAPLRVAYRRHHPRVGNGMTTSASAGASSARSSPILCLEPATSRPSKRESGRAKYTYSKTHRARRGVSAL